MIQPIATREARGDRPRLSRDWFVYLAVLLAAAGLVCVVIGSLMPAYTEPVVAERIRSGAECERGVPNTNENRQCDSALWHRSMDTLRTNKWSLVDGGGGLLASASMMFVFCWWSGQKSWRRWLTPKSGLSILALASSSWLMQIPAYDLLFMTELMRGYHPHWADSIAIPVLQTHSVVLRLFL